MMTSNTYLLHAVRTAGALLVGTALLAGCGGGGEGVAGGRNVAATDEDTGPTSSPSATAVDTAEVDPSDTPPTPTGEPSTPPDGPTPPTSGPTPSPSGPTPVSGVAREDVAFPGCETVTAESSYCLTVSDSDVSLLGLDSGVMCPVVSTSLDSHGAFEASLGWLGEEIYVCDHSRGLLRVSLSNGDVTEANLGCGSVTDYRGGLLVSSFPIFDSFAYPLQWYENFAAAIAGEVGYGFGLGYWSSRMTTTGDAFYGAWHAGFSVEVGDLSTDQSVGVLTLEDYDDWIHGIAVTNDDILVLGGRDGVVLFDVRTGEQLRALEVEGEIAGLSCVSPAHRTPPPVPTPVPSVPTPTPDLCGTPWGPETCGTSYCAEIRASLPPRPRADFPPSIPIAMNCGGGGYGSSNYVNPAADSNSSEELHVVGVYEGIGNPGFREDEQGRVDVIVRPRPKPVVLFLNAYGSMLWRIQIDPGAELARVITQGYGVQEVSGVPDGVVVEHRGSDETCGLAYGWEAEHGHGYHAMIATARDLTGLTETSFQGCYSGRVFEIPHWSGDPPIHSPTPVSGDETLPNEQVSFPGCEAVTAERQYCLTMTADGIGLLGLDSGQVCPLVNTSASINTPLTSSIVWRGEIAYACGLQGLVRVSLRDGSTETAQVVCGGVAEYDGGIALMTPLISAPAWPDPLVVYPNYAALLSDDFSHAFPYGSSVFNLAIRGETLYTSWHSTDTIQAVDLATGSMRDVLLEGYDGWILGIAATDEGQLIISGDTWGGTIRVFDAQSGEHVRVLTPTMSVRGLSCVTRAPEGP